MIISLNENGEKCLWKYELLVLLGDVRDDRDDEQVHGPERVLLPL